MDRSLRIYLLVNCLGALFLTYIVIWLLNFGELQSMIRGYYWGIFLVYFLVANGLNSYAKKIGDGLLNPVRTVKRAKYFRYASLAFFFGGVTLGVYYNKMYLYAALIAIPLDILKIYVAHQGQGEREETEILDDFDVEEIEDEDEN